MNDFSEDKNLVILGARENNLKNIDLSIPRNALVVFTGLSGSGKSSLALDSAVIWKVSPPMPVSSSAIWSVRMWTKSRG